MDTICKTYEYHVFTRNFFRLQLTDDRAPPLLLFYSLSRLLHHLLAKRGRYLPTEGRGMLPRRRASTTMMSTTADTDKQDKRDERNEGVSSYVLLLFIQHLLLLTLLFLLLVPDNLDGTG